MEKISYLATFQREESGIIKDFLSSKINDIEFEIISESFLVFKTSKDIKQEDKIKNLYIVLKKFENLKGTYFKPIFQWAGRHTFESLKKINENFGFKTFRIILQDKNKIISGHRRAIKSLEKKISDESEMRIDRVSPHTEIWITHTKDSYGFILFKIN